MPHRIPPLLIWGLKNLIVYTSEKKICHVKIITIFLIVKNFSSCYTYPL